jgi:hypothetical protein
MVKEQQQKDKEWSKKIYTVFVLSVRPSVRHTVCQRNSSETTEQNFFKLGR